VSGVPAALAASWLWGTADFLAGRASRTTPALLVAFVGQAAGLAALAAVLALRADGGPDPSALGPGACAGLCGVVAVLAFYRALALGTMSVVAPIVATSAAVPVLAGVLDGERPGGLQWAGVALAMTGVVLAAREPAPTGDGARAIPLALLAAVMLGLQLVFLGDAAQADALGGVAASRAVSVTLIALAVIATVRTLPLGKAPELAGIGLLDTGANVAFALATTGGLLALVAVLGSLFPVVTIALAYVLLGERLAGVQRAGTALALVGVLLISAG